MTRKTTKASEPPTVPYTATLPDGRTLFIAIPEPMTRRDRDGGLLLKPAGVRRLDQARALAMRTPATPSPAYIRTVREALGLTQSAFAKRLGYSLVAVKRWETGTLKPGRAAVDKLRHLVEQATKQGLVLAA